MTNCHSERSDLVIPSEVEESKTTKYEQNIY